jgi:hypothetical protein
MHKSEIWQSRQVFVQNLGFSFIPFAISPIACDSVISANPACNFLILQSIRLFHTFYSCCIASLDFNSTALGVVVRVASLP